MAKDPVCGMDVRKESAIAKSEHIGKTYYFCCHSCKMKFDADPVRYAGAGAREMTGHGDHGGGCCH